MSIILSRCKEENTGAEVFDIKCGQLICFSKRSPTKPRPNEDCLGVIESVHGATVLMVADGLGGLAKGESASMAVVKEVLESLKRAKHKSQIREAILQAIQNTNELLLDMEEDTGTTLSLVEISDGKMRTYQIGDSFVILTTKDGRIKYESNAHSVIGYAVQCGGMDLTSAMRHSARNIISNYVGYNKLYVELGPVVSIEPNDTLLISSDGLNDNLYAREIAEFIYQGVFTENFNLMLNQCQKNMLNVLNDRLCHPDDLTVVGLRYQ